MTSYVNKRGNGQGGGNKGATRAMANGVPWGQLFIFLISRYSLIREACENDLTRSYSKYNGHIVNTSFENIISNRQAVTPIEMGSYLGSLVHLELAYKSNRAYFSIFAM